MSDESKKMSDFYGVIPEVVTGVFVVNKEGKFLFIKSPKWKDKMVLCGGHIEYGENLVDSVKREVKEEVGLEIYDIEFVGVKEFVNDENFSGGQRHLIGLQYFAKTNAGESDVIMQEGEVAEYFWFSPEEALQRNDVHLQNKEKIEEYLTKKKKEKKGLFVRECKKCETTKKEAEEYKVGWQRALADYKNLQKETSVRRAEWAQMSEQQILDEFIPIYENFKTAFNHHPILQADNEEHKQIKNWVDGIGFIQKQFSDVLKSHNLEEIKTVGEKFDPKYHEAAGEEIKEGVESGMIIREVSGGYKIGDKVIRAARVIISK